MSATSTREQIWQTVAAVPPGKVATYGQIATLAGLPRHARFVGRVLGQLPHDTELPWHRIVNARGEISFPPGSAAHEQQKRRLEEEGIGFTGARLNLKRYQWQP